MSYKKRRWARDKLSTEARDTVARYYLKKKRPGSKAKEFSYRDIGEKFNMSHQTVAICVREFLEKCNQ